MKTYILLFSLFLTGFAYGQVQVKKSSISCGGGTGSTATYHVVYSIGEVAMSEKTMGATHVSEGFIGPDLMQALGVEHLSVIEGLQVYPNPVDTYLKVEYNGNDSFQVAVFSLSGKEVISNKKGEKSLQLNLQSLSAAEYLVQVRLGDKVAVYKIIKK